MNAADQAVALLERDGVIVVPTDTVLRMRTGVRQGPERTALKGIPLKMRGLASPI